MHLTNHDLIQVLRVFVDEVDAGLDKGVLPNFAVWSRDTQETVLHMVLKKSHSKALAGLGDDASVAVSMDWDRW